MDYAVIIEITSWQFSNTVGLDSTTNDTRITDGLVL